MMVRENNMNKTKKLTVLSLLTTCALVLSYVEAILPPLSVTVPGIKVGLCNIIILFVLYRFSFKAAVAVSGVRLLVVMLLFSNPTTFVYSLAGAALSLVVMALLKRLNVFSIMGVSIAGAVCHNLGQIMVAAVVLGTLQIGYYMIILAITGSVAGVFVGLAGAGLLKATQKMKL